MRRNYSVIEPVSKKSKKVATYNGYDIELNSHCEFLVPKLNRSFESIAKAKENIDSAIRQLGRVKMVKLDYSVIDQDGDPRTITGVHVTTRTITVTDGPNKKRGAGNNNFYPDTPLVRALLGDKKDIEHRMNRVDDCLRLLEIEDNFRSEELADGYEKLSKDIKAKTKLATDKTKIEMYEEWELHPEKRHSGRRFRY